MKNFIIGALIIAVAVIVGLGLVANAVKQQQINIGASSGPEHFNKEFFYNGLVQGGGMKTITSSTTCVLSAGDLCDYSILDWLPSGVNSTATWPTSTSTFDKCMPANGMFKDIFIRNISTVASSTITFSTVSGVTFLTPYGGSASGTEIWSGDTAKVRLIRVSSTSLYGIIDQAE